MTETSTHDIRVDVETRYLSDQSDPDQERFVFSYTITLQNQGNVAARLLSRKWRITDANGKVQEVEGEGVVGEFPHLDPGESYRYTSGTIIATPVGSMEGHYRMEADDGDEFHAPIEPFRLAVPGVIN